MESTAQSARPLENPMSDKAPSTPHSVEEIREALSATEARARESRIAMAAYYQAEKRGFAPGGEMADWLVAERDLG